MSQKRNKNRINTYNKDASISKKQYNYLQVKMKKISFILLALLLCSSSVMAQNLSGTRTTKGDGKTHKRGFGLYLGADRDTLQYIVASPFDNWYIEGGVGGQTYIGNEYVRSARFNSLDYNLYAEIGKWVIPDVAVALNLQAYGMHGQTRYGPHPWVDFTNTPTVSLTEPFPGTFYEYEPFTINGISLTGLVYIEWTNLFNGYEIGDQKRLHVMTPVGLGYSMLYGGQRNPRAFSTYPEGSFRRNFELHFMAGLGLEYRVFKAITLHATASLKMARGSLDYSPTVSDASHQSGIFDFMPTLQVGARFNMIKRVTKVDPRTGRTYTAIVHHQFLPANNERISYLESRIDTLVVQMESLGQEGDAEAAANLAAVRNLNRQLDSLQRILSSKGNDNTSILAQIDEAQHEIESLIKKIERGRTPLTLELARELVGRQLTRQDSLDLLAGRLARLQSDLSKDLGNPAKIKAEIAQILDQRELLLDNAEVDNYEYGIDDEQGLYSPLDASQTAYRHVLYNDLLGGLYRQLALLQQKLDNNAVDRQAVSAQIESVRTEINALQGNLSESGTGLSKSELGSLLARQRQRRDSIQRMSDQMMALQIAVIGDGNTSQNRAELDRLRNEIDRLSDVAKKDNTDNLIDNEKGTLSPYVAAQAATEQSAIRRTVDQVLGVLDDAQLGISTNNLDPKELMDYISTARQALDSINRSVDVGGLSLNSSDAQALLDRQLKRLDNIQSLERQMAELQRKLENGEGNPDQIKAEIKRLATLRQDIIDQAEDDNVSHGVTDDHGNLNPFEAAQLAAKHVSYRSLIDALDRKMEALQSKLDSPTATQDEVREQIHATKAEIDIINKNIGESTTTLTVDQLRALVSEQMARQDSIAFLDRRIASLNKRFERGSGDPRQLTIEINKLKQQRDALKSASKKANADKRVDDVNNTLSPLVAAQSAYDQTSIRNRLGYIRSMLDALLRNMGARSSEQAVQNQILAVQAKIDSIVVAGHIEGAGMNPAEADSLVARQQQRTETTADIDRRLRDLQRLLDKDQGDPDEIRYEMERLRGIRSQMLDDSQKDNRSFGIRAENTAADNLAAALEAAKHARRLYQLEGLTTQLDSLQALLVQERMNADPMAQINDAIAQLDLPMARVYYQLDKWDLDYNARKVLHDFALRLKRSGSDLKYYIIGAADAQTGSVSRNKLLSTNRCKAVYDVLVRSYGVPEEQLEMYPLGGITEFEQQENNRTAIIVLSNHEITKIIEKWHRINEGQNDTKSK